MDERPSGDLAREEEVYHTPGGGVQERRAERGLGLSVTPELVYPARATTRAKLERIFGYVFTAVARFKKLPAFSPVQI